MANHARVDQGIVAYAPTQGCRRKVSSLELQGPQEFQRVNVIRREEQADLISQSAVSSARVPRVASADGTLCQRYATHAAVGDSRCR